jgi:hypothetical protein
VVNRRVKNPGVMIRRSILSILYSCFDWTACMSRFLANLNRQVSAGCCLGLVQSCEPFLIWSLYSHLHAFRTWLHVSIFTKYLAHAHFKDAVMKSGAGIVRQSEAACEWPTRTFNAQTLPAFVGGDPVSRDEKGAIFHTPEWLPFAGLVNQP